MNMFKRSIRKRMLLGLLVSMLAILGSVGTLSTWVTQEETEEVFSARLATSARVLEALLARQLEKATLANPIVIQLPDEIGKSREDKPMSSGHPYENKIAFQIWSSDGVMLARSSSAPSEQLGPLVPGFHETTRGQEAWKVFVLSSGSIWVLAAEKSEVQQEMIQEISASIVTPLVIGGTAADCGQCNRIAGRTPRGSAGRQYFESRARITHPHRIARCAGGIDAGDP